MKIAAEEFGLWSLVLGLWSSALGPFLLGVSIAEAAMADIAGRRRSQGALSW